MAVFAGGAPLALHSLDLSPGSTPEHDDHERLARIRILIESAGVSEIRDHLGYSALRRALARPLPSRLARAGGAGRHRRKVDYLQDVLGVRLALENVALTFDPGGEMTTAEFLNELVAVPAAPAPGHHQPHDQCRQRVL